MKLPEKYTVSRLKFLGNTDRCEYGVWSHDRRVIGWVNYYYDNDKNVVRAYHAYSGAVCWKETFCEAVAWILAMQILGVK